MHVGTDILHLCISANGPCVYPGKLTCSENSSQPEFIQVFQTSWTSEDLLQDIPVELQFAVAQEFSDHLSAQALPLQQEVCYPNGRVWDETTRDQEMDASFWVPARG